MISKLLPLLIASSFIGSTASAKTEDNNKHLAKERYLVLAIGLKNTTDSMHKEDVAYQCTSTNSELTTSFDSSDIKVRYINIGNNSLALLPLASGDLVLSNVIAADGVKYVGADYIWWTKGTEAILSKDTLPSATMTCKESKQD